MDDNELNPFASPPEVELPVNGLVALGSSDSADAACDEGLVVVPKGGSLPPRCFRCNSAEGLTMTRPTLRYWSPSTERSLRLLGVSMALLYLACAYFTRSRVAAVGPIGAQPMAPESDFSWSAIALWATQPWIVPLFFLPAVLLARERLCQRAQVGIGCCRRHRRRFWRDMLLWLAILLGAFAPVTVMLAIYPNRWLDDVPTGVLLLLCFGPPLAMLAYFGHAYRQPAIQPIIRRMDDTSVWLGGAGLAFVVSLPPARVKTSADGPEPPRR
jgi:hypothetical protein